MSTITPEKLDKELGNGGAWISGDMTHRSASRDAIIETTKVEI